MRRYSIIVAVQASTEANCVLPGLEFLMIQNAKRGSLYELPGGEIEENETPIEGARREFLEETGHDWHHPVLAQQREGPLGQGFVFVCHVGPRLREPESNTLRLLFTPRLPPPDRLSFPDDPYDELFAAARRHLSNLKGSRAHP